MTFLERLENSIQIFKRACPKDYFGADHDIIYGPSLDTDFTDLEKERLEDFGWFESDEYDCWCLFV